MNSVRANSSSKSIKREEEQPSNWTSGNSKIDKIIRKSQESGRNVNNSLEWIPFKQFYDIRE
ncbi:1887_t:CDS:2, partial [Acaulospora morrowiae]